MLRPLTIIIFSLFLSACTTTTPQNTKNSAESEIGYLAKSDIDTVADVHLRQTDRYLKELAYKLYRRNPRHCDGGTLMIKQCVEKLFNQSNYPPSSSEIAIKNIKLSLNQEFSGDRVAVFLAGLRSMIHNAYSNKTEFFFFDELDPQKLYNSARNIEIAVWRLSNYRDSKGRLLLLTNSMHTDIANLSFERLFGKLVATQDTIAEIIAESSRRRIKNIIQRLATAVFLPI